MTVIHREDYKRGPRHLCVPVIRTHVWLCGVETGKLERVVLEARCVNGRDLLE